MLIRLAFARYVARRIQLHTGEAKRKEKRNLHEASKPVIKFGHGAYAVVPAGVFGQQDHPSNVI
ncbi:hypothetical protein K0M31_005499 [Melipona bicolor]|uniref:Uncharacterized protein n=1 Tax=Melipona bicolor TaxID=60889 RepID=A0AA40FVV8_9HYME|nr:hypothetical protein K0M31_005499 [Melipona bicolor]